ncbi:MAG: hypothetical protein ACRDT3_02180 [Glutamicibacter sp.]
MAKVIWSPSKAPPAPSKPIRTRLGTPVWIPTAASETKNDSLGTSGKIASIMQNRNNNGKIHHALAACVIASLTNSMRAYIYFPKALIAMNVFPFSLET